MPLVSPTWVVVAGALLAGAGPLPSVPSEQPVLLNGVAGFTAQPLPPTKGNGATLRFDPGTRRLFGIETVEAAAPLRAAQETPPHDEAAEHPVDTDFRHGAVGDSYHHECHHGCRHGRRLTLWQKIRHRWHHHVKPRAQERYWGYPEEFIEQPHGSSLEAHLETQRSNGEAGRMVLYDYDFVPESGKLKLRGKQRLKKIARMLPENFFPVVIEPAPGRERADLDDAQLQVWLAQLDELDQARRETVLKELAKMPFPVPEERVVVPAPEMWRFDPAIPNGLHADEVGPLYHDMLRLQPSAPSGGGGGGRGGGSGVQAAPATGQATPGAY